MDVSLEEGSEFPASNIITGPGMLPADKIPVSRGSRNMVEAHFKTLRCFRKWCRYMPFVIHKAGFRVHASPEEAKLQLALLFRQNKHIRDPVQVDIATLKMYERLYNIQNGDVWGSWIMDFVAPHSDKVIKNGTGFSTLDEDKYGGKSEFLEEFLEGDHKKSAY